MSRESAEWAEVFGGWVSDPGEARCGLGLRGGSESGRGAADGRWGGAWRAAWGWRERLRETAKRGMVRGMQRVVLERFGPASEGLRVEELELPALAGGEVRVRLLAAPVNPADLNLIEGTYGVTPPLPCVPGIEGCGEIIDSRAAGWSAGTRVLFLDRVGTWRSHLDVDPGRLLALPAGIDARQAAMLKVNPLTAWLLLTGVRPLKEGSWVVQNAANSGVGRCVIQLARELGLRTLNIVRRPELADELRELGADAVVADDESAVAEGLRATGGERPAVGFNAVGGESALRLLDLLADGGIHVTYGAMSRRSLKVPNSFLIFRDLSLRGLWVSRWLESAPRAEVEATYADLARLVKSGGLAQPVDSVYPLAEVREACARAAAGGRAGKVLLVP